MATETEEGKQQRLKPISEGYLYFRDLLVTANSGHIETELAEGKIVVCLADYYCSNGHKNADFSPEDGENPDITILVGKKDAHITQLLRPENGMYPQDLMEQYCLSTNGVNYIANREPSVIRTHLGDTIQVDTKLLFPHTPNWARISDYWINDPERSAGLANILARRIKESFE